MDEMTAFERQLASRLEQMAGPDPVVDVMASVRAATTRAPRMRFQAMFSATKFVLAAVIVALFGGFLLIAQPFQPQGETLPGAATSSPGTFSPAGSLTEPRAEHTATLLSDGRVLIVGGASTVSGSGDQPSRTAEVWDPATASFVSAGSLTQARMNHTATLLPDGHVLVIGGNVDTGDEREIAEVWDPATASFNPAGSPAWSHHLHTATLLPDGRVLVVGGSKGGNETMAEVWDPTTASFSPAGRLAEGRRWHSATLLPDGRVLVVGGAGWVEKQRATAEMWDPSTSTFALAVSPTTPRSEHTATLLPDGHILIVGGYSGEASAEIWDPDTAAFGPAASLAIGRDGHTATLLPDGRVLVVGGSGDGPVAIASAEVWAPSAE